ncbi:MAG: signal recognition particle protein [Clostridia bacterium]
MAVFEGLSEKLNHIFSKMTKRGKLTELEIKQAMREIRIALLEADVNIKVAKQFIEDVSVKALGQDILSSLTPAQQVIKIINEELVKLMGSSNSKLIFANKDTSVFMICGLQGAGKTTLCGKLALYLKKQNKSVLLVGCDVYRPAAIEQLKIVGKGVGVEVFEMGQISPVKIAKEAVKFANKKSFDVVILDTAGRLHIDEKLMDELKDIKKEVNPCEIMLTVDAMTGQDAVNVAETFDKALSITGVILTKLDGDTRGGAALSIKAVTGKPIKFSSIGEKSTDLEPFHPDRMASRILGMGDVLTLIEKAQSSISEEQMKKMEKNFRESRFTFNDYLTQMDSLKNMGDMESILGMIPGMSGKVNLKDTKIDEKKIGHQKAIILSMTNEERNNPEIISGSRRKRIAAGSGTSIQEVNQLLKQFEQMKLMMKSLSGAGKKGKFAKLPF